MKRSKYNPDQLIDTLFDSIDRYIPLSNDDKQIIKSLFIFEEFPANSIILNEGTYCNKLWFIAKGLVRFTINDDGNERTFVFRKEGHFTSDIEGLLSKTLSNKKIIAIEDCAIFTITYENLQKLYQTLKDGERFGRKLVEEVFLGAVSHIVSFYTETPEQRFLKFQNSNPDLLQRIPQYLIASFLGIEPQSLSRIKKRIQTNLLTQVKNK